MGSARRGPAAVADRPQHLRMGWW